MKRWLAALMACTMVCMNFGAFAESEIPAEPVPISSETKTEETAVGNEGKETKTEKPTEVADENLTLPAADEPETVPAAPADVTAAPEAASEPTAAPETQAPTEAPAETQLPSQAPETETPVTKAPETQAPVVTPVPYETLEIAFSATDRYAFVDRKPISTELYITGGDGNYVFHYTITRDGREVKSFSGTCAFNGVDLMEYRPASGGNYKVSVVVSDGCGQTAEKTLRIPVAEYDRKGVNDWRDAAAAVELTGRWDHDLLALALSQIGYEESITDFIIDKEGRHGFTLYGSAAGGGYYEWCAAFIQWCIGYMDLDQEMFPSSFRVREWMNKLTELEVYVLDVAEFTPAPGDLIFFNDNANAENPHHIGIVEKVADGMVHTVEGNVGGAVRRMEYELADETIVGYADVSRLQQRAEPEPAEPLRLNEQLAETSVKERILTERPLLSK